MRFSRLGMMTAVMALTLIAGEARADAGQVQKCIQTLGDDAVSTVKNQGLSAEEKRARLEKLFLDGADIPWMGKFVLGVQWRRATPEQQQQYLGLYQQLLLKNYTARFQDYTGSTFTIEQVQPASNPGDYTVQTKINRPGQDSIDVDYRAREAGASCKVFDIMVEGVSLIATQRSEYTSYVSRQGMPALINELQRRINGPVQKMLPQVN